MALVKAGRPLSKVELALSMGLSPGTGSLHGRAIGAKRFGLTTLEEGGSYVPTALGMLLARDADDLAVRTEALLSVDAYVRSLAATMGDAYVVTGPLYEGSTVERVGGRVLVPTSTWKALWCRARARARGSLPTRRRQDGRWWRSRS